MQPIKALASRRIDIVARLVDLAAQGASLLGRHAPITPTGVALPRHFGLLGPGFDLALDRRLRLLHRPRIAFALLARALSFGSCFVAIGAAPFTTLTAFTVAGQCRQAARCQNDGKNNMKR